jgi:hypothetical protein
MAIQITPSMARANRKTAKKAMDVTPPPNYRPEALTHWWVIQTTTVRKMV